ncbi:DMSO/TMAO reductase YedYZ molybdopterin-dependent catalytic subunit [Spinactinospora alkalitolerans]|uniref:DMSO/TMAO reductase YedYZ molybdopterin-dependent catalytic subunit n=1 Tax=Spinactinospora alkalitolerans TaxID=687207 RepID=A0A852TZF4_9ACTN|nr:sulfite oxidase-like oxidoreductase [Spinactinospora alkalitolerans]NYE48715.1 DMSO/TMAO reductase YedYZ molybdopterin-dependent catalytic subunit [Spinactinospora alkalitolerans]
MSEHRLPPGQYVPRGWPALHYGPVPRFRPQRWDFRVYGVTETLGEYRWTWPEFEELPRIEVVADFHCVTKFTIPDNRWSGVSTSSLVELAPPHPSVTHVMVWAEYGYSANLRVDDFLRPDVLLATHRDGDRLAAEHGHPVRLVVPHLYGWKSVKWVRAVEYLTADRRGFWEERGYHNLADPWAEQRYSYQEEPGQGPSLD